MGEQRADDVLLLRRRARGAPGVRPRRAARAAALRLAAAGRRSAAWRSRSRSTSPSTPAARPRTAGESRCRPTPPSRSACSRSSGRAFPTACARSCSRSSSSTTCSRSSSSRPSTRTTLRVVPLLVAVGLLRRRARRRAACECGPVSSAPCSGRRPGWRCSSPGVEPVVVGLAMGLLAYAYPAPRSDLERATERFREFREQPTPELARVGRRWSSGRRRRPNERLQQLFHPWTSYVIVPLFALANAGIAIDGGFLARAFTLADHARDPVRLRRRQAGRHPRRLVAGDAAEPRAAAAAGGLGGRRRRRHDRRDRLHRRAARRDARLRRAAARGGEARHPLRGSRRRVVTWLLFRATALLPRRDADPRPARHRRAARRPLHRRRSGARPHPRARSTRPSRSSSTAISSAPTAARPSRSSASSCATSATSATSGGTSRSTTSTLMPSSPPRRPRQRPRRAPSGRCTTSCSTTRTRSA